MQSLSYHKKNLRDQIRFLSFNVNGIKTFFQYHPFNKMGNSLDKVFQAFESDVITFQELKTSRDTIQKYGKLHDYHSFITLPKKKLGYSGVGCWVRKITDPQDPLYQHMQVAKAEEGITGYLEAPKSSLSKAGPLSSSALSNEKCYRDDHSQSIGGYQDMDDIWGNDYERALELDSQGRCILIELSCNLVVFSCYCPANSMGTDEGELYRMQFMRALFKRASNLHQMGKKVVIMGDINISRDLIDNAEAMESGSKNGWKGVPSTKEKLLFIQTTRPSRLLMNQQLADSIDEDCAKTGFLFDSTRKIQGYSKSQMFTVWNTLLNTRPMNYGSRVDYILVSDADSIKSADILPDVQGSDHCPIYTDLQLKVGEKVGGAFSIPRFECKYHYKLISHNILDMFNKRKISDTFSTNQIEKSPSLKANHEDTLFFKPVAKSVTPKETKITASKGLFVEDDDEDEDDQEENIDGLRKSSSQQSVTSRLQLLKNKDAGDSEKLLNGIRTQAAVVKKKTSTFTIEQSELGKKIIAAFGNVPKCKHGVNAVLRTSKTQNNFGKKFWVCGKPRGADLEDPNTSCGFFQWA
ncbi:hypothetical protein ACO0QE_002883 [Hanseniaspora vineae]